MARKNCWFASSIIVGIVFAMGALFVSVGESLGSENNENDYNRKIYIGDGTDPGTVGLFSYFETLEDWRQDDTLSLVNGDIVRLFADEADEDASLAEQLRLTVSGTVKFVSSDLSARRILELAPLDPESEEKPGVRRFLTASVTPYSTLQIENLVFQNAFDEFDDTAKKASGRKANGAGAIRLECSQGYQSYNATLINTDFLNNTTDGSGGAIHVRGDTVNLTLKVANLGNDKATTMTFSGNKHLDRIDMNDIDPITEEPKHYYTSNSIAFTNNWSTNFVVDTEQNTLLDMQDPFKQGRTDTGTAGDFRVTKQGLGTWRLGGTNQTGLTVSSSFQILEGTLELTRDAGILMDGSRDSFRLTENATLHIRGGNTISAGSSNGIIRFDENSTLTFDFNFFDDSNVDASTPMLDLTANTIIFGYKDAGPSDETDFLKSTMKVEIEGIDRSVTGERDYVLVQGNKDLQIDIDSVALFVDGIQVEAADVQHERFGYSLHYGAIGSVADQTKLILNVAETKNMVLEWNGNGHEWNRTDANWNRLSDGELDTFISGDSVLFNLSGTNIVNIGGDVVIAGVNGSNVGMQVSGDGHWTFTGKSIRDNESLGRASLRYDGSGSLTLENAAANSYAWTELAGTGTLYTARADLLGTEAVVFAKNNSAEASKLHFTAATTLTTRLVAENGSNGLVTVGNDYGVNLTITRVADETETFGGAIYVKNGGKLHVKADPVQNALGQTNGRITFNGNGGKASGGDPELKNGGAAFVEKGGELILEQTEFVNNSAWNNGGAIDTFGNLTIQNGTFTGNSSPGSDTVPNRGFGGAISISGTSSTSQTTIIDSTFVDNRAGVGGGAIAAGADAGESLQLTIAATNGGTTLFSGNMAGLVYDPDTETRTDIANSIYFNGANRGVINLSIETALNGTVDMRDAIYAESATYRLEIAKNGEGTWKLGGQNEFKANRDTKFKINNGTLELYKGDVYKGEYVGIDIATGSFEVRADGALNSLGANYVNAQSVTFAGGATLGFDLDRSAADGYPGADLLLTVTANSYEFGIGNQFIDIIGLSTVEDGGAGIFNLAQFVGHTLDISKMELLFHGEKISSFREVVGTLLTDGTDDSILQVKIETMENGTTQWTGKESSVWNGEKLNWKGIDQSGKGGKDLSETEQFLHGDAVIFTNEGAGLIEVNAGGVVIADQVLNNSVQPGMTVDNSGDNDYTFHGGSISGGSASNKASLLKRGNATLTFEQENAFLGGVTVVGGTIVAKKIDSIRTFDDSIQPSNWGTVDLVNRDSVVQFDVTEDGTYRSTITGNGAFVKSNVGSLRLSGNNAYSGGTTILGGELVAEHINSFGLGSLVTGEGDQYGVAVFDLNTGNTEEVFAQVISGTGSVKNVGETALVFTEKNLYSGGTINEAGATLEGRNVGSFGTGDISNQGTIIFNLAPGGSGVVSQNISGVGGLKKDGAARLILTGNNSYTGETTILDGELQLGSETAAKTSIIRVDGGTLTFGNLERVTIGGLDGGTALDEISLNTPKGEAMILTINQSKTELKQNEIPNYLGKLTGSGVLVKDGSGTQILAGENTYSGGTMIQAGRLVSGVDGLGSGDVINNAELEFCTVLGKDNIFDKRIVGSGALYKTGNGTLELTGFNTYSGGTFIDDGHLKAYSFDAVGTGNIVIRNEKSRFTLELNKDAELTREISGAGDFYKTGKGNLFVSGNLALAGTTNITAGTLFLNGTSRSETIVWDGGTLSGNGVLGNTAYFKSGASHRVGTGDNAQLTSFTADNLVYEDGSKIFIKVGNNGSDQIIVKNSIDFGQGGGNVEVVLINLGLQDFNENSSIVKTYEVFVSEKNNLLLDGFAINNRESDESVLTMDGVNASVSFQGGEGEGIGVLGYEVATNADNSKSIFLNVAVTGLGAAAYLDWDQQKTLWGINDAKVLERIYAVSQDYRGGTVNYLMPQIQTIIPFHNQRAVTQFNQATYERIRFLREPLCVKEGDHRTYRGSSYRLAHLHGPANHVWFQNYGDFLKMSREGSLSEFRADSYGFNVGYDNGIDAHSVVGFGMGGFFSDIKANDVHQEAEANSFLISLYGSWFGNSDWTLTGSTGFVFGSYELDRYADPFNTRLSSRHDGLSYFASFEVAKKCLFDRFEVTPYFGLDMIWLGEDGYTEKASGDYESLALKLRYQSNFTCLSSLGVRFGRACRMLGGNVFHPTVYAAWVSDWTDSNISTRASFAGMPSFKIKGASTNRHRAQLGLNLNMTLSERVDTFARFNAEMSRRYSDVSVHWGIRLGF